MALLFVDGVVVVVVVAVDVVDDRVEADVVVDVGP